MNKNTKRSQLGFWKLKLDTKIKFKIHKLSTWYSLSQKLFYKRYDIFTQNKAQGNKGIKHKVQGKIY